MTSRIEKMTLEEKALEAMTLAVREAQERQWKLGLPVWVWQDGKIVNLPPPPELKIPTQERNTK